MQARRPGLDESVFNRHLRTHGLQAGDVQIYRARADCAAARHGHIGLAIASQERSEYQD